jgi:hypothetical protein
MKNVFVYLYGCISAHPGKPHEWGTMDAILSIYGCAPITRSAMKVDASLLDEAGLLPYGLSPYDLESGIERPAR